MQVLQTPFTPQVVGEEEETDVVFERFFPEMESYAEPNLALAPHPPILERRYRLAIVQEVTEQISRVCNDDKVISVCGFHYLLLLLNLSYFTMYVFFC